MVVMFDVTDPVEREHAMAKHEATPAQLDWKAVLTGDENGFRALLQTVVQEVLEAEMTEALQAEKNERTASRLGHRSGYYDRKLVTRIGVLELRVPQDRAGRFSTELFERYQRSEKALVAALAEMYVQGVSTRKVKAVTEELCGHSFSASAISDATARLDGTLKAFAERCLDEPYPYLILAARYERVREAGVIRSQAVLIAIGVDWEGRHQVQLSRRLRMMRDVQSVRRLWARNRPRVQRRARSGPASPPSGWPSPSRGRSAVDAAV
jgi:putative transposase